VFYCVDTKAQNDRCRTQETSKYLFQYSQTRHVSGDTHHLVIVTNKVRFTVVVKGTDIKINLNKYRRVLLVSVHV